MQFGPSAVINLSIKEIYAGLNAYCVVLFDHISDIRVAAARREHLHLCGGPARAIARHAPRAEGHVHIPTMHRRIRCGHPFVHPLDPRWFLI